MKKPEKDTFEWHQLKIARQSLKMTDIGLLMMKGMTREEAQRIVNKYK